MDKLVNGRIPAGQECPWKNQCRIAKSGECHHLGEKHTVPFSCAVARGFELVERYSKKPTNE